MSLTIGIAQIIQLKSVHNNNIIIMTLLQLWALNIIIAVIMIIMLS